MSLIVNEFERICKKNSNKVAFYYIDKNQLTHKSYKELYNDVILMSSYLVSKGVKKEDKILAFASSGYNLCVFILAAFKIGASVMYVNIFARQESLKRVFEKYRPEHILVSNTTKMVKLFFKEINQIKNIINIDDVKDFKFKKINLEEMDEDIPGLITLTTGSTGNPKMFIRTHKDLYNQLQLVINNIQKETENEVVLTTSYIYIFANILQGFTTVLPNINLGSTNDNKIIKKLNRFKDLEISMIITSPDFCLRTPNIYPKLKTLYFGGAILNYNEANKIKSKYENCNIIYIYGSTECNVISKVGLDEYVKRLKEEGICIIGKTCKGVEVKIDANNHILVKSEALLTKSLDEIKIDDGYYDTNDIGKLEDNNLIYLGKNRFYININNRKVYANEIEQKVCTRFTQIEKCAVLEKNNRYYIFVEDYVVNKDDVEKYIKKEYGIDIKVYTIKIIPRDIKHHTKINYIKLERILETKKDGY